MGKPPRRKQKTKETVQKKKVDRGSQLSCTKKIERERNAVRKNNGR